MTRRLTAWLLLLAAVFVCEACLSAKVVIDSIPGEYQTWTADNGATWHINHPDVVGGMEDGPNLYAYVKQNPWSAFDAHGLFLFGMFDGDKMIDAVCNAGKSLFNTVDNASGWFFNGVTGGYAFPDHAARFNQELAEVATFPLKVLEQGSRATNQLLNGNLGEGGQTAGEIFGSNKEEALVNLMLIGITHKAGKVIREKLSKVPSGGTEPHAGGGGKSLLPTEGDVATYDELIAAGTKGDNITPHHIPSANHIAQYGIESGDGIAINMEHPHPGSGGRHRETFTYGTEADASMTPRDALASGVRDARSIYQKDGLYNFKIRPALQNVIRKNLESFPSLFEKQK